MTIDSSCDQVLRFNGVDWIRSTGPGCATGSLLLRGRRLRGPPDRTADAAPVPVPARRWPRPAGTSPSTPRPPPSATLSTAVGPGVAVLGGSNLTNESAYAWARLEGRDRHRPGRRPARRRPARRGVRPARRHHRRRLRPRRHRALPGTRSQGGAAGPVPAPQARRAQRRRHPGAGRRPAPACRYGGVAAPRPGETAGRGRPVGRAAGSDVGECPPRSWPPRRRSRRRSSELRRGRSGQPGRVARRRARRRAVFEARPTARFLPVVRRGNTRGAVLAGLTPAVPRRRHPRRRPRPVGFGWPARSPSRPAATPMPSWLPRPTARSTC